MFRSAEKWIAIETLFLLTTASILQAQAPRGASTLSIAFKLDSRMSGPTYGGERWVTPPTFSAPGAGSVCTAEARAEIQGKAMKAKWTPADSAMVTVSQNQKGDEVTLTVHEPGQSSVDVSAENMVRTLLIKTENNGQAFRCSFTPGPSPTKLTSPSVSEIGPSRAIADSGVFKSEKEKQSYALGMKVASDLRNKAFDVDTPLFSQGFKDAVSGGALLSTEEMQATIAAVRNELRRDKANSRDTKSDLAETNRKAAKDFLAENQKKEGVVTLPGGLQYKVLKAGEGPKPTVNDRVVCNYRGTFVDGEEFDSSYKRKSLSLLSVGSLIPGWKEALQLMPLGSKWQIFVPPDLAYGERGVRTRSRKGTAPGQLIGPNKMLIFEVELLYIESNPDVHQQAQQSEHPLQPGPSKPEITQ